MDDGTSGHAAGVSARLGARVVRPLATLSLRQRATLLAVVSVGLVVGVVFTAMWATANLTSIAVATCVAGGSAVAAADYVFRARRRIAELPTDRSALARGSMRAYERSRGWIWWGVGASMIWNASEPGATTSAIIDLLVLSFCAVGFGLGALGFWRAGSALPPTRHDVSTGIEP